LFFCVAVTRFALIHPNSPLVWHGGAWERARTPGGGGAVYRLPAHCLPRGRNQGSPDQGPAVTARRPCDCLGVVSTCACACACCRSSSSNSRTNTRTRSGTSSSSSSSSSGTGTDPRFANGCLGSRTSPCRRTNLCCRHPARVPTPPAPAALVPKPRPGRQLVVPQPKRRKQQPRWLP